ncbi:MAG: recombinase family protein [Phycisphaerales bacterium]|nr:recombinase family protein [Phycisphaerales bacterium]
MKKIEKTTQKFHEKLIAYYRVSTAKQGRSGLGFEGQKEAVQRYAVGCGGEIIHEYTEVESGKRTDRIELTKATAHARRSGCKLVIAKLDRLSRNVAFISTLMENGFEFVCCDNPHVNRITLHVLAAVAEEEARAISARTKAALAAAKKRGVKLGSKRPGFWTPAQKQRWLAGLPEARKRSAASRHAKAIAQLADLLPTIRQQREQGITLQAIANGLNKEGHQTPRGCIWSTATVQRALRL